MLGEHALISERALAGDFPPGCGHGRTGGEPLLFGRRMVSQSKSGELDVKIKVIVVDDSATMRKKMRKYLKKNGLKKNARMDEEILPRAIFWLKK